MTLVAALTVTPIALLTGQDFGSVHGVGWLWLVLLVLIPGAAGHGLMTWAHAHVDVSTSSVLVLGEPVLATFGAAVFLGESVNGVQRSGSAVVIAALAVLAVRRGSRRSNPSRSPPRPERLWRMRRAEHLGGGFEVVGHLAVVAEDEEPVEAAHEPAVVGHRDDGAFELLETVLERLG